MKPKIKFIGGPYDGKEIEDCGVVTFRMGISKEWENGRPKVGSRCGDAVYEPTEDRSVAFWSHNNWLGVCDGIEEFGDIADESGESWKSR